MYAMCSRWQRWRWPTASRASSKCVFVQHVEWMNACVCVWEKSAEDNRNYLREGCEAE